MISVLVVGAGPVGHTLAAGLARAGYELRHWSRSRGPLFQEGEPPEPVDVVLLAVRDDVIAQAARFVVDHGAAGAGTVLVHCAGALPPLEVLQAERARVRGCGLLHPLLSISDPEGTDLAGTVAAISGDAAGLAMAERLAHSLGAHPLPLLPEQLGAYHAAAALAAGHVAAVLDAAVAALTAIGLDRRHAEEALAGLSRSVMDNVTRVGLPAALTGPAARGDVATVQRHLQALPATSPEAAEMYRLLLPAVLRLAQRKGSAGAAELQAIEALLRAPAT